MASPVALHDFVRKFQHFGVMVEVKGSHIHMRKVVDGAMRLYIAVVHRNKVDHVYVDKARRRFALLLCDGVTDAEFRRA